MICTAALQPAASARDSLAEPTALTDSLTRRRGPVARARALPLPAAMAQSRLGCKCKWLLLYIAAACGGWLQLPCGAEGAPWPVTAAAGTPRPFMRLVRQLHDSKALAYPVEARQAPDEG